MPRSVRGLGDSGTGRRDFLKQESYSFKGQQSAAVLQDADEVSDATTLIRECEAWAAEAFRLPADFLHSLTQPGKKKRRKSKSKYGGEGDAMPFLQEMPNAAAPRQTSWSQATPRELEHPQRSSRLPRKDAKGTSNARGSKDGEDDADVFDFLTQLFGFQRDSVRNQRDNAILLLASRLARSREHEWQGSEEQGQQQRQQQQQHQALTPGKVGTVLMAWRKEQLANYKKWCRHIWSWQIKLKKVLPNDPRLAYAFEIALNLLLWGEAANLRLCPEFLCWCYHKSAKRLRDAIADKAPEQFIRSYLKEVIQPCYLTLAEQYEDRRAGSKPYMAKNYDDFNETFWQRGCLSLDVVGLTQDALRRKFNKTFVERQSWLVPLVSFWRVQMMLFWGLHFLVVASVCTTEGGCAGDNDSAYWYTPVFTLAGSYVLIDVYQIVFVTWRKIFVQCHLLTVLSTLGRAFLKVVALGWLYTNYPDDIFINSARLYYGLVALLELLKFTPLIGALQGTVGPWSIIINVLLGVDAAGSYARIDRTPSKRKVLLYSLFWIVVLVAKFLFNFFFMIRPLVRSTRAVWDLDIGGRYDLGFVSFRDTHNVGILVGVWLSVAFVYFIDLQVWFIVAESVASACYGVARHVGERLTPREICGSFEKMYKIFFRYMEFEDQQKHFRFAYVWNEVVDAMRKEDIIGDKEMAGLKYFIVSLHRPNSVLALLPGFLVSGKIQASVKTAKDFAKQQDELIKALMAVDAWGGKDDDVRARYEAAERRKPATGFFDIIENFALPDNEHDYGARAAAAKSRQMRTLRSEQRRFLRGVLSVSDAIREVAFLHLFLSVFFLMEHLCQSDAICAGLWDLYDFVTARAGAKNGTGGSIAETLMEANPNRPIFLLHNWPDVVSALDTLVSALLDKNRAARNVRKAMEKLCLAMAAFIDPTSNGHGIRQEEEGGWSAGDGSGEFGKLRHSLEKLQAALAAWPKSAKVSQEEVDALHKDHNEFLMRFHSLVSSTNRPGHVESWEGQRRIAFFVNSMYMHQPEATRVENMPAFSTLTPYYSEEVILSVETLCAQTPDGVTTLEYLQTLYPEQWTALVERVQREMPDVDFLYNVNSSRDVGVLKAMDERAKVELQLWASYRAQTLARTVRGMMYYEQAVRLLAVVEAGDFSQQLYRNVNMASANPLYERRGKQAYVSVLQGQLRYNSASREAASAKFTYVVSCQQHAKLLRSGKEEDRAKAKSVELLMEMHPSLKVAYVEAAKDGRHYSVLIRYDQARSRIVKQYEVELPGPILVGEGKPNNQNHAIIFTRGEAVQAIDMNQDGALEDALKIRQLLGEFDFNGGGNHARIVGFREFVFTHDVSSIANFFSLQELSFVTSIQRFLDKPLSVRFHYGHPDLFDKVSAMTLGGISKASKGINLSEDIFGGFNFVLRGGKATQAEYIQVGKGRDVGLGQIVGFVAKISMGNGMQARSREVHRIAQQLDIFRLLSYFYSSVGFYLNQVFLTLSIWLFVYAKVYLVFDSRTVDLAAIDPVVATVVSTEYIFQLGFMLVIPVLLVMAVESGLFRAIRKFVEIILRGSVLFFVFLSATNAYYVNKAFLTGEAKYMSTGRGFVIVHDRFLGQYCRYLQSHFLPAFEMMLLLIVYWHFGSKQSGFEYVAETFSVWLLVVAWLWSPIIFNPNGVEWLDVIKDFDGWLSWMMAGDDDPDKSWHAWWIQQNAELADIMFRKKVVLFVWRCRFLVLVWGFVTAIKLSRVDKGMSVPEIRWLLLGVVFTVAVILVTQGVAGIRTSISGAGGSTSGRLLGLLACMALGAAALFLPVFNIVAFEQMLYFAGAVGFLLYFLVVQASLLSRVVGGGNVHKAVDGAGNSVVWNTYRAVHLMIGLVIMIPTLVVAFFPFMTHFQTRMLFNQNFSARFTSAKLFAIERERQVARGWIAGDGGDEGGGGGSGGSGGSGGGSASPPLKTSKKTRDGGRGAASSSPPQPQPRHSHGHGGGGGGHGGEARGSALPPVRHSAHHPVDGGGGRTSSRTKHA